MRASFDIDAPIRGSALPFVHRLDVRTKMAASLLASVAVILLNDPRALGVLAAGGTLYALSLRRERLLLVIYGAIILMWAMAVGMMHLLQFFWPRGAVGTLSGLLVPFLRTWTMANAALGLALSSRIQSIMGTLKTLRLPFCVAIPLTVMIRFLPVFVEDARQIAECIRTRGYAPSPWFPLTHPRLSIRLMVMPLLFRSLRSSDELGVAAELKGLGEARRMTPRIVARFGREDALMAAATLLLLIAAATIQIRVPAGGGGMGI
jgi:energy-coupling factor transport system permease protein